MKAVGGSRIDSIDSLHPQAVQARLTIDNTSVLIQNGIWWFNRELDAYIDTTKPILKVKTGDKHMVWRNSTTGFRDTLNHTDVQADTVVCEYVVYELPFEDLPESVACLIMYTAAEEFIRSEIGDEDKIRGNSIFMKQAAIRAKSENTDNLNINHMDFPRVARVTGRIRPHWRSRN